MSMRTTSKSVVFARPFSITGVDLQQPAGVYIVETDEEPIEDLSFLVYRRVETRLQLAEDPLHPGIVETVTVNPAEIEAALGPAK